MGRGEQVIGDGVLMEAIEAEFRKVGFTAAALDYPLSDAACAVIAEFNGVDAEKMPLGWRYAPNLYMHRWMEWLGKEKAAGRSIWNADRSKVRQPEVSQIKPAPSSPEFPRGRLGMRSRL
jgi:hypothetical protein